MRMDDNVIFGEKAEKKRAYILEGLREGRVLPEVYLITPPMSGSNLLEIYPAIEFLFPPYDREDRLIKGIAVTYWEALEVVREMIERGVKRGEIC